MSRRDKTLYALGTPLYFVAGWMWLKLIGAPMDAVNELLKVIALSVVIFLGICWLLFASVDRWTR